MDVKNLILFFRRVFQATIVKSKIYPHINPMQQFNSPASNLWVNEFNRAVAFNQITTDDATVSKFPKKVTKGGDIYGFEGSTVFLDSRNNIRVSGQNDYLKHGLGDSVFNSNGPGFATPLVDQLEDGETIAELFYEEFSLYALTNFGNLFSCGKNDVGQLGLGNTTTTGQLTKISGLSNVVDFSVAINGSGGPHCLAITASGALYVWGYNGYGQLGLGNSTNATSPVLVSSGALAGKTITKARAIGTSSYVIDSNGDLFTCGFNTYGQLGLGNTTPVVSIFTATGEKADEVYGSGLANNTSCAFVLRNGQLKSAGDNGYGQLGLGDTVDRSTFTTIPSLSGVVDMAINGGQAQGVIALKADGTVRSWGYNGYGALGTGTTLNVLSPTAPSGSLPAIAKIYQMGSLTSNSMTAFLLSEEGQLYVAGVNGSHQGTGKYGTGSQTTFVRVEHGKHKVVDFRPFYFTILAKTDRGELLAWGYNTEFQTGSGAGAQVAIPQLVRI